MKVSVVRIGNSRGIRIPKPILEECELGDVVELEVKRGQLLIRSAKTARSGWAEAFREMAAKGDDTLLDDGTSTQWDRTEWKW